MSAIISDVSEISGDLPTEFSMEQNYPNPYNPSTIVRFEIPKETHAHPSPFTILGQFVGSLVDADLHAGTHTVRWNAAGYPSGVYLCQIQAGTYKDTKKLFLLK